MLKGKTFLAVIPARGGSKRLPHKNILNLHGKPLIAWSIEAAKKSKYIDEIIVSSEDMQILNIAAKYDIKRVLRPKQLAHDTTQTIDVVKHSLKLFQDYDYVVLLQPTSPLRTNKHIDDAIIQLLEKDADGIISVCEAEHSPQWTNTLDSTLDISSFLDRDMLNKRSQELKTFYRLNGAIYIADTKKLLEYGSFFLQKNVYAYIMPQQASVDIDTQLDFDFANFLLQGK